MASRLAWTLAGVTFSGAIASVVLIVLIGPDGVPGQESTLSDGSVTAAATATFAIIGALVAARHPRNPIGWILCAQGVGVALIYVSIHYAVYALVAASCCCSSR